MTEEKLHELADRVAGLSGADRGTDAAIAVALKIDCRPNLPDDLEHLSLPDKRDPGPGVTAGHYWFHCRSGISLRSADFYTALTDAAAGLVPAGWDWATGTAGDGKGGHAFMSPPGELSDDIVTDAATPAIALCCAALRARAKGVSRG